MKLFRPNRTSGVRPARLESPTAPEAEARSEKGGDAARPPMGGETTPSRAALRSLAIQTRAALPTEPAGGAEASTLGAQLMGWVRSDSGRKSMAMAALGLNLIGLTNATAAQVMQVDQAASPLTDAVNNIGPASSWLNAGPATLDDLPAETLSPLAALLHAKSAPQATGKIDDLRTGVTQQIRRLPKVDRTAALAAQSALGGTHNEPRALRSFDELLSRRAKSPTLRERVDSDVMRDLTQGVAQRRTTSVRGESGVLEARHVRYALDALEAMPADDAAALEQTLAAAGGTTADADAVSERALIYKALAARSDAWTHGDPADASAALEEVQTFAAAIRGRPRDELIRKTSPLDLDDQNTSLLNADVMRALNDSAVDNDGLNQRFSTSCGPTTGQILRAEADPVFALSLHQAGISSPAFDDAVADQQRAVLTTGEGTAVSQVGKQAWRSARAVLRQLHGEGVVSDSSFSQLRRYAAGKVELDSDISATLKLVRDRDGGHPDARELWAMRADGADSGKGMSGAEAFNRVAASATHSDYDYQRVPRGRLRDFTDRMAELLEDGQDIGLRVADGLETGHYMMIADVRGEGAQRRFQVADPWSGKNAWVEEAALVDGSFLKADFDLSYPEITHLYAHDAGAVDQAPGVELASGADATLVFTEALERQTIGGKNKPARMVDVATGDPAKGLTLTIHGINDDPSGVAPLTTAAVAEGGDVKTLAYDDNFRRLKSSADDLKAELRSYMDDHPGSPLVVDAHSMGGRVALKALGDLANEGALDGRKVELNLIASPLTGYDSANMTKGLFGPLTLIKNVRPSKDMGSRSRFQRDIAAVRFGPEVTVRVFTAGEDAVVDWDTDAYRAFVGDLGATHVHFEDADHNGAVDAAAAWLSSR